MRHGFQLAGITLLWFVGLKIYWDCLVPHCIMGSRDLYHRPLSDRLETPLRWASADPIAFVMLMSTGALPVIRELADVPRSTSPTLVAHDSSRNRARTALAGLAIRQPPCSISCISGDIVANRQWNTVNFIIARARNVFIWIYQTRIDPTMLNFVAIFIDMPPALPEARKLFLTVELSNPKSTRAADWQIYTTCIICVSSQNCGLLSTHNLLIIHMNECTCTEFLWHFFRLQTWCQNYGARTMPESARCSQHQPDSSLVLAHCGM